MNRDSRRAILMGIVVAAGVGLLVKHSDQLGGWLTIMTFLGVIFLVVNAVFAND